MKIISLNTAEPKIYNYDGRTVTTSILKEPVDRKLKITNGILEGNKQHDLKHHGGIDKAVYGYPIENYEIWNKAYLNLNFNIGCFGENLTTEGVFEKDLCIGDIIKIGTCKLQVSQPRQPCSTFGFIMRDTSVIKYMVSSGMCGFYFRVLQDGELEKNDVFEVIEKDSNGLTISEVNHYYYNKEENRKNIENAVKVKALSKSWKDDFIKFLSK